MDENLSIRNTLFSPTNQCTLCTVPKECFLNMEFSLLYNSKNKLVGSLIHFQINLKVTDAREQFT